MYDTSSRKLKMDVTHLPRRPSKIIALRIPIVRPIVAPASNMADPGPTLGHIIQHVQIIPCHLARRFAIAIWILIRVIRVSSDHVLRILILVVVFSLQRHAS